MTFKYSLPVKLLSLPAVVYFDFHHHHTDGRPGIFNLPLISEVNNCFSVGLHPMNIEENWREKFQKVADLAKNPGCVAIGECGFDARSPADEGLQKEVFQQHLTLAKELGKPLIVHCVRRYDWLLSFASQQLPPLVVHGFNKNEQLGKELLRKGFKLSLGVALLQKASVQKLLAENGLSGIFFETDENPLSVEEIYRYAAQILNKEISEVQQEIQQNLKILCNGTEMAGTQ